MSAGAQWFASACQYASWCHGSLLPQMIVGCIYYL